MLDFYRLIQCSGKFPIFLYNCAKILFLVFSQARLPLAALEVFHTMHHMNCDPDRASFDILIDAFGKAGFVEGMFF